MSASGTFCVVCHDEGMQTTTAREPAWQRSALLTAGFVAVLWVLEVVDAFARASGREIPYEIRERRPGDVAASYADPTRAARELGWTARRGAGEALRRLGLLLIPEERQVPAVLERANALFREWRDLPAAPAEAVRHLAGDPVLAEAHRRMLPPPRRPRLDPLDPALLLGLARVEEAERLEEVLPALSRAEKAAVLGDARGLDLLLAMTGR